MNCKLVAHTCEARDAPSKGLDRIPAQTQFHFRVCVSLSPNSEVREREGALWREGRNEFVVGLNGGRPRGLLFTTLFFLGGFATVHLHRPIIFTLLLYHLRLVTRGYEIICDSNFFFFFVNIEKVRAIVT